MATSTKAIEMKLALSGARSNPEIANLKQGVSATVEIFSAFCGWFERAAAILLELEFKGSRKHLLVDELSAEERKQLKGLLEVLLVCKFPSLWNVCQFLNLLASERANGGAYYATQLAKQRGRKLKNGATLVSDETVDAAIQAYQAAGNGFKPFALLLDLLSDKQALDAFGEELSEKYQGQTVNWPKAHFDIFQQAMQHLRSHWRLLKRWEYFLSTEAEEVKQAVVKLLAGEILPEGTAEPVQKKAEEIVKRRPTLTFTFWSEAPRFPMFVGPDSQMLPGFKELRLAGKAPREKKSPLQKWRHKSKRNAEIWDILHSTWNQETQEFASLERLNELLERNGQAAIDRDLYDQLLDWTKPGLKPSVQMPLLMPVLDESGQVVHWESQEVRLSLHTHKQLNGFVAETRQVPKKLKKGAEGEPGTKEQLWFVNPQTGEAYYVSAAYLLLEANEPEHAESRCMAWVKFCCEKQTRTPATKPLKKADASELVAPRYFVLLPDVWWREMGYTLVELLPDGSYKQHAFNPNDGEPEGAYQRQLKLQHEVLGVRASIDKSEAGETFKNRAEHHAKLVVSRIIQFLQSQPGAVLILPNLQHEGFQPWRSGEQNNQCKVTQPPTVQKRLHNASLKPATGALMEHGIQFVFLDMLSHPLHYICPKCGAVGSRIKDGKPNDEGSIFRCSGKCEDQADLLLHYSSAAAALSAEQGISVPGWPTVRVGKRFEKFRGERPRGEAIEEIRKLVSARNS